VAIPTTYVSGQVYTEQDRGRSQSDWVTAVNSGVLSDAVAVNENAYGLVDGQGRPAAVFVSAARTTTQTSAAIYSRGAVGVIATMVVTAKGSAPSVTMSIQTYDFASATWVNLLTSAAITNTGTTRLTVSPQVSSSANVSLNGVIPDTIRVVITASNSDSLTYSVGLDWTP
jgi:hypothetical protein